LGPPKEVSFLLLRAILSSDPRLRWLYITRSFHGHSQLRLGIVVFRIRNSFCTGVGFTATNKSTSRSMSSTTCTPSCVKRSSMYSGIAGIFHQGIQARDGCLLTVERMISQTCRMPYREGPMLQCTHGLRIVHRSYYCNISHSLLIAMQIGAQSCGQRDAPESQL
jgi:hypothetical protein